jgi:cytochrome c5
MKGLIAGLALTLALGLTTGAQADAVKERYDQSCTYCHSSGAAGAPKTGDQAAW